MATDFPKVHLCCFMLRADPFVMLTKQKPLLFAEANEFSRIQSSCSFPVCPEWNLLPFSKSPLSISGSPQRAWTSPGRYWYPGIYSRIWSNLLLSISCLHTHVGAEKLGSTETAVSQRPTRKRHSCKGQWRGLWESALDAPGAIGLWWVVAVHAKEERMTLTLTPCHNTHGALEGDWLLPRASPSPSWKHVKIWL